jgi:hypothetical protein
MDKLTVYKHIYSDILEGILEGILRLEPKLFFSLTVLFMNKKVVIISNGSSTRLLIENSHNLPY